VLAAKPSADAKSIQLDLTSPSQPVIVRGDDRRLRQILWNLTTNAVKFTNEGRISVSLSVIGGAFARLEVTDTGRGIDPAFLPHVWDRFRQADSSTSREYGGLGLGLAVVKHLVEMHGGTAIAGSAGLGHGATFRVDLPLARVLSQATAEERQPRKGRLTGKRILLVDDDEDARLVLAAMLRQGGADVTTAASPDEAMSQHESQIFDAVVSDLAMPGEDGFSLLRRLHAVREVPVIAVSAIGTGSDDRKRAIDAGFVEFVRKPVEPDELVETVAGLS
jgi:CheY-like chemotaxis protein